MMKVKQLINEGSIAYRFFNRALYKSKIISHKVYSLNWDNHCMKELRKKIWNSLPDELPELNREKSNKVWICWLQGIDNAPPIVKACYARACDILQSNYEVILIDQDNFSQYAKLPEWVVSKWKRGQIGNAHFSDLLRMQLLIQHGGIWIDSTAYLTDEIPRYISECDLFLFRTNLFVYAYPLESAEDGIIGNNWFIAAKSNDPFLVILRDLLLKYWSTHNSCIHYYIWHLMFSIVSQKYPAYWKMCPMGCDLATNYFGECLGNPYSQMQWENIKSLSFVHKLSWKISPKNLEGGDTFYERLIKGKLE